MYADLAGQVALITGGAGAIGRAIAEGLVQAGARVALVDIDRARLDQFCEALAAKYGQAPRSAPGSHPDPGTAARARVALPLLADVRDSGQVRRAFDQTLAHFGRLDILVNNAAVTQIKAVDVLTDDDIDAVVDTNLKGYIKCAREAVRVMKAAGTRGSLLFISSKNGLAGASDKSLYSATKGGELTLARSLALELGRFGIRVNTICPDAVLEGSGLWEDESYRVGTAQRYNIVEAAIPNYYKQRAALKVNIEPRDVANAALFLLSDGAAKITGAIIAVDGGVAFVR